jgi:translation initiation factor IF-2
LATTRVYILAKELGVKSSSIVKKCQDEGLDVRNHMATISAGLAATIREWFSEGENVTTVETADKVDLDEVRVRKRPQRKKVLEGEEEFEIDEIEESVAEVAQAVAEPPVQVGIPAAETAETEITEPQTQVIEEQPVAPAAASAVVEELPPQTQEPVKVEEKKVEVKPELEVKPAGPMLEKPSPARLSGPQIVRVEAPEVMDRPRPRFKPRHERAVTEPLMYRGGGPKVKEAPSAAATAAAAGDKKGKHKDRTHGRRKEETTSDDEGQKKAKQRTKLRQRDIEERQARLSAAGGEGIRVRPSRKITSKAQREAAGPVRPKRVSINEPIVVKDLSSALGVKAADIIGKLIQQGVMATANQSISNEMAELVALEFDTELAIERRTTLEEDIRKEFEARERAHMTRRAVVAAMLGHVDHGKTSLLDRIRRTDVAAGEAGGITQHIGASQVKWDAKTVTFLDTPGHEAFTAMRARGANMTDIVVLTVAANDGVMPQTVEAIAHSKAAGVPIVVALNKIDLPGCDLNRIYAQLSEQGLTPTEWGGDTEIVKTSAVTGQGIDDLLEALDYVAELRDLKADDTIPATGWVVEAKLSAQQGPVATVLIKEGRLSRGDVILAGKAYGRVKAMRDS